MSYVKWVRDHVGHRKVFLPFATVIARDAQGRVLLQRRSDFDFWGLPGGILEMEETVESAARRELLEETGLTVGDLRLVGVYSDPKYDVVYPNGDEVQQFTVCLEGVVSGGEMQPDGVETIAQRFVNVQDLEQVDLPIWYREMLDEAQMNITPQFRAPNAVETADQIATIRPYVGTERFSGIGAAVVFRRGDGKMLMLQHVGEQHWRIPSGFADLGENVAQTAVREMKEELGLDIELLRLIGVHATPRLNSTYSNGDRIRNVGVIFEGRHSGGDITIDPTEIAELAWMDPAQAVDHVQPSRVDHYRKIVRCLDESYFID